MLVFGDLLVGYIVSCPFAEDPLSSRHILVGLVFGPRGFRP